MKSAAIRRAPVQPSWLQSPVSSLDERPNPEGLFCHLFLCRAHCFNPPRDPWANINKRPPPTKAVPLGGVDIIVVTSIVDVVVGADARCFKMSLARPISIPIQKERCVHRGVGSRFANKSHPSPQPKLQLFAYSVSISPTLTISAEAR